MSKIHRRDFLAKAGAVCGAGAAMTAVPVAAEQTGTDEGNGAASMTPKVTARSPGLDELRERLLKEAPPRAFFPPI
jgi:hypothetical protein